MSQIEINATFMSVKISTITKADIDIKAINFSDTMFHRQSVPHCNEEHNFVFSSFFC